MGLPVSMPVSRVTSLRRWGGFLLAASLTASLYKRFSVLFLAAALFLSGCSRSRTQPEYSPTADIARPKIAETLPPPAGWPTVDWQSATPESQGMDGEKLAQMLADIEQRNLNLHSLLIIRNGFVVSENYFGGYAKTRTHLLYSCTKSFIATLVGIAVDQGEINSLDQKVLAFFPDKSFEKVDEHKQVMTLENLLTMTSGLDWEEGDAAYSAMYQSDDWVKQVLDLPMRETPGSTFNYCSGCSHVLSAILNAQTGMTSQAYADENLFGPLGIEDYSWDTDASGNAIGGWGLWLTPRQMAKLGYLFLHKGEWDGRQIVSESWVEQATQAHVNTGDDGGGYGYQWWVLPNLGGYAALGRAGQTIFVAPDLDLVVVTTAEIDGHDAIYRLLDRYILPAANP